MRLSAGAESVEDRNALLEKSGKINVYCTTVSEAYSCFYAFGMKIT